METDIAKERHIKTAVISHAISMGLISPGATVASEFALGTHRRRADLAAADKRLIGFEIKSSGDTLRRLPEQLQAYLAVFDTTILVVAQKHLSVAREIAPPQVGIWVTHGGGRMDILHNPSRHPSSTSVGIVGALTISELEREFGKKGLSRSEWSHFASTLNPKLARLTAFNVFRRKFATTSDRFWCDIDPESISSNNISQLSRFAERRRILAEHKSKRQEFWNNWSDAAIYEFEKLREGSGQIG